MNSEEILVRTSSLYSRWAVLLSQYPSSSIRAKIVIDKEIDTIRDKIAKLQIDHYDLFFKK